VNKPKGDESHPNRHQASAMLRTVTARPTNLGLPECMDGLCENPKLVHDICVASLPVKSANPAMLQDRLASHRVLSNRRGQPVGPKRSQRCARIGKGDGGKSQSKGDQTNRQQDEAANSDRCAEQKKADRARKTSRERY